MSLLLYKLGILKFMCNIGLLSIFLLAVEDQAFVTLATNDQYCYGALVLGQSLRDNGTTRQLAILVTPQVSQPMR